MSNFYRAVFDTNVLVAASLSRKPNSPTRELVTRWKKNEFSLITCAQLQAELAEKLFEHRVDEAVIEEQLTLLAVLAEWVEVPAAAIPRIIAEDADDDVVLACAVISRATHLVTYDPHFDGLGGEYHGIQIVKALPFLWAVRGDQAAG